MAKSQSKRSIWPDSKSIRMVSGSVTIRTTNLSSWGRPRQ